MGLSSRLQDVSADSLPLLLLAAFAASISYLRSLLLRLLHHHPSATAVDASSLAAQLGSGFAGLAVLADHLASNPSFSLSSSAEPRAVAAEELEVSEGRGARGPGCVVCLNGFAVGERVRRLPCRHAFHGECIEGWFAHQMNLSCPLCRSPLVAPEYSPAAGGRIGAELVAWFSS